MPTGTIRARVGTRADAQRLAAERTDLGLKVVKSTPDIGYVSVMYRTHGQRQEAMRRIAALGVRRSQVIEHQHGGWRESL
jgi:hypothetical protein